MSRLTNYIKEVSAQARQRGSSLYHSRLLRFGFLATLASAFVMPMLLPVMASLFLVAPLLYHGAMSVARPLMADFSLRDVRRSLSSVFNGSSDRATVVSLRGDDSQERSEEKIRKGHSSLSTPSGGMSVPKGRKTGEPMVDLLIKRLRDAGFTVTTDWKHSRKYLASLPDKYKSLKQNERKMYGFVYEGVIHINPSKKALETPLHEYTHIWAEVLRQKNPDEWKNIVGLMKQENRLWNHIVKSYPHLETDDEIADEVLATYSGKRGAELLKRHYQQGDDPGKALNGVMEALKAFWSGVCGFFKVDFSDRDEIADTILSDFLHGIKLMDDLDMNRQTFNDRMPLGQTAGLVIDNVENTIIKEEMKAKSVVNVLTGEEARHSVHDILASIQDDGNSVHYPALVGTAGYFRDTNGNGDTIYSAFDNTTGDCWCEDFKTAEGAEKWCRGELSTDEVRQFEGNVDEIILSKESFSEPNQMPPYVKFDEHGEFALDMQFHDGYAFDTNPHGLGLYDRIGLYYPTVAEVAKSPELQEEIEDYTDRRWAEGSRQEQIYDIALKYGQASRIHCPKERFDDAVKAIVERAADPSAKAFTPEQREKVQLAAACNGEFFYSPGNFRETFYDSLFGHAQQQMQRVPIAWANDAHQELKELANDKVRDEGIGLHR